MMRLIFDLMRKLHLHSRPLTFLFGKWAPQFESLGAKLAYEEGAKLASEENSLFKYM